MTAAITVAVGGMHCAGCAQRAAAAAGRIDGVVQATADHATGQVRLIADPTRVDATSVAERLTAAGFEPVEPADVEADARR